MKAILVPTDFSPEAENAIVYASELNKKIMASVILFHSYFLPVPITDIPILMPSDEELKKDAIESINKIKQKFSMRFPDTSFDTEVKEGFPENEIITSSKKNMCDLIVMGTRGASGLKKVFIGSNTTTVIEKSICPVIAVPGSAQMKGLSKIVFAANFSPDDYKNIFELIEMATLFESEIILLHIDTGNQDKSVMNIQLESFLMQVKDDSHYTKISLKIIDDYDVYHGLNTFLESINPDMLAISMRNRSFAQKLFNKSITKEMVFHNRIPIMAFHTTIN